MKMMAAGDPSEWAKLNARHQPFFADFAARFGFDDVLLLDTEGNVVYSTYKGVYVGANVLNAPYATTTLTDAYHRAMWATSVDDVVFTDYERYAPAYGSPTPWVVTPIGDDAGIQGALALQLSPAGINDVMTGQRSWVTEGLGQTGETYLAGPDMLMRSVSRELLVDPEKYVQEVVANGTPESVARRQVEVGDSVMLQPIRSPAVSIRLWPVRPG